MLTGNSRGKYLPCNSNISGVIQPLLACRFAVTQSHAPVKCIVLSCTVLALPDRQTDTTHSYTRSTQTEFCVCLSVCLSVSQSINSGNEWSSVLLEQLVLPQLVNTFSPFYRTRRSITVFTKAPLLVPVLSNILDPWRWDRQAVCRTFGKELPLLAA